VAVDVARGTVTIVGEARDTVSVDARGMALGADEKMAAEMERQIRLTAAPDGPVIRVAVVVPDRDELARLPRPTLNLTIRVPSSLNVQVRQGGGELSVSDVAAVHVPRAEGRMRVSGIAGALTGDFKRGALDVERVGSVALKVERCEARFEAIAGAFEIEAKRCELRARKVGGASTLKLEDVEGELEEPVGPVKLKGRGGAYHVRAGRGPIDAESERTTLYLVPAVPVAITATVEHDDLEVTLPRGGVVVDAMATHGDIRFPDGLLTLERGTDVVKATATVLGGGPRVQLRTTRGDIVVR
jgi:hypothetical protein